MKATRGFATLIHQLRPPTSQAPQSLPLFRPYTYRAAPILPLRRSFTQPRRPARTTTHLRYNSNTTLSPLQPSQPQEQTPTSPSNTTLPPPSPTRDQPSYSLSITCKPCKTRSTHTISKQGYHNGTILVTCPSCKARHIVADHLKIFSDQSMTIESMMREKGEYVKRGSIDGEGNVEFWDGEDTGGRKRAGNGDGERAREEVRKEVDDL